jgi:hypothetical protein
MLSRPFTNSFAAGFGWGYCYIVIDRWWAWIVESGSGKGLIVVISCNITLNCVGNCKFVSSLSFHLFPIIVLDPPTLSFFVQVGRISSHIRRKLVPSSILEVHLVANPLGPVSLVLFVPETSVVGYIGVLPATFVLGAL